MPIDIPLASVEIEEESETKRWQIASPNAGALNVLFGRGRSHNAKKEDGLFANPPPMVEEYGQLQQKTKILCGLPMCVPQCAPVGLRSITKAMHVGRILLQEGKSIVGLWDFLKTHPPARGND